MHLNRLPLFLAMIGFAVCLLNGNADADITLPNDVIKSGDINLRATTAAVVTSVNHVVLQRLLQDYLDELGVIGYTAPAAAANPPNANRKRRTIPEGAKLYKLKGKYTITLLDELEDNGSN
uniref:Curli production assembly/transport component CsgF n=1 Tax=Panagrellus redivivus TaxID=6233 RepID=A0A7E4VUB3_PANRE